MNYQTLQQSAAVISIAPSADDRADVQRVLGSRFVPVHDACCLWEAFLKPVAAGVIVYDAESPDSWRDALEHSRSRWPQAHFLLISRLADDQLWVDALQAGVYEVLP